MKSNVHWFDDVPLAFGLLSSPRARGTRLIPAFESEGSINAFRELNLPVTLDLAPFAFCSRSRVMSEDEKDHRGPSERAYDGCTAE